ncbi:MAG: O-antigen ligase family protein [Acidiferrobacteraceae bacterium]
MIDPPLPFDRTLVGQSPHAAPAGLRPSLVAWLAIALGAAIPVSVAAANVLAGLLVLAWLAKGSVIADARHAWRHPVVRAAIVLLAVLAAGTLYGQGSAAARWNMMGKYLDLLLLLPLMTAFTDPKTRHRGAVALLGALALTLVLSWLIALAALPRNPAWFKAMPGDASVFKDHITQSLLMAFAAFAWAAAAMETGVSMSARAGYAALTIAAVIDILFFVEGRTGYVVLMLLAMYLFVKRCSWRHTVIGVAGLALLLAAAYRFGPSFHLRVDQAVHEAMRWRPDRAHKTPVGLRLDFYENSLRIIRHHPWIGVGTGGFVEAYAREASRFHMEVTRNPHDQFLLVMIETGLPGLAALIGLLLVQWRSTRGLPSHDRLLAQALVCTFIVGCLVDSPLIDYTERLFYVFGTALFFSAGARGSPS